MSPIRVGSPGVTSDSSSLNRFTAVAPSSAPSASPSSLDDAHLAQPDRVGAGNRDAPVDDGELEDLSGGPGRIAGLGAGDPHPLDAGVEAHGQRFAETHRRGQDPLADGEQEVDQVAHQQREGDLEGQVGLVEIEGHQADALPAGLAHRDERCAARGRHDRAAARRRG